MDRRPSQLNRAKDAYRALRAPADAHGQALNRFASRHAIRRLGWLPVAAFASAVGVAVLVAPRVGYPPDVESVALSPVALARLDMRQAPTTFTPTMAALSIPALSDLEVPSLNRISIPKLTVEQETL